MEKWGKKPLIDLLLCSDSGIWGEPGTPFDGFPVLRSTNISNWTLDLSGDLAYRKVKDEILERFRLVKGDIIVTKSSGSPGLIGQSAIFDIDSSTVFLFSNFIQRLRPNPELVLPDYLHAYLRSFEARQVIDQMHRTTSGLRNLKLTDYLSQSIPLPYPDDPVRSLAEQRRIVARLDAMLEEVREMRALIRAMRVQWGEVMQSALGEAFEQQSGIFSSQDLETVVEIHDSGRVPVKESERKAGTIPCCGANGIIDYVDGFTHDGEFVLLAEDGETSDHLNEVHT